MNSAYLASLLQGALSAVLKDCHAGRFKRKPWDRRGPGTSGISISGGYLDHISRHVNKETKEVVYRSEPYQLCGIDIVELAALVEQGWSVAIHGGSPYYPGNVALEMARRYVAAGISIVPVLADGSKRPALHISGPFIPPIISIEERDCIIRCARAFDEAPPKASTSPSASASNGELRPGDDFDIRGWSWGEILEPHGWTLAHSGKNGIRYWRLPGKTEPGWSATTGKCRGSKGEELFRVFSSNAAPFETVFAWRQAKPMTRTWTAKASIAPPVW